MSVPPAGPGDDGSRPTDPPIRFLDPSGVRRRPGRRTVEPTWYVADRLLVHGTLPEQIRGRLRAPSERSPRRDVLEIVEPADDAAVTRVEREARRQGCRLGLQVRFRPEADAARAADPLGAVDDRYGFVLRLLTDRPDIEPDAWEVLEVDRDDDTSWRLSLDHVMSALPFTSHPFTSHPFTSHPFTSHPFTSHPFTSHPFTSHPFTSHPFTSHPFTSHPMRGLGEYAVPGSGGRAPVRWLGGRPPRETRDDGDPRLMPDGARRPVVAVVDTGVGTHEWFGTYSLVPGESDGAGVVIRDAALPDGTPLGTYPVPEHPEDDAEIGGTSTAPLTGPLDPVAGHGTFIAGLVHQVCPDARILPVRAVGGSGLAIESEVIESLRRLESYQRLALAGDGDRDPVDVVVLSMGYYHEQPEDMEWDHPLGEVLGKLRDSGVAVVVAAGNDGVTRPEYPAAFAPEVDRRADPPRITVAKDTTPARPPVLAVGALNPDGTTALFSNDGPWVTCLRPGAAVVSTVPRTLDGPITPSVRMKEKYSDGHRATIDPEGFQGGFATWSGTSFAAPVLAGEIAGRLLASRRRAAATPSDSLRPTGTTAPAEVLRQRVDDVWAAIEDATGGLTL